MKSTGETTNTTEKEQMMNRETDDESEKQIWKEIFDMKKDPIFTGAAVAINTPMHEDGSVNYDEFARFVDWQNDNRTD